MTRDELKRIFPNGSDYFLEANAGEVRGTRLRVDGAGKVAKLERTSGHGKLGQIQVQKGIGQRFLVRVKSFRKRLLDEDNLCEKYHVDLCRYAGALPKDAPGTAKIEVSQEKVGPKEQERVEIKIYRLE